MSADSSNARFLPPSSWNLSENITALGASAGAVSLPDDSAGDGASPPGGPSGSSDGITPSVGSTAGRGVFADIGTVKCWPSFRVSEVAAPLPMPAAKNATVISAITLPTPPGYGWLAPTPIGCGRPSCSPNARSTSAVVRYVASDQFCSDPVDS